MKVPDHITDFRMRLPSNRQNYFSTFRTIEYFNTYRLGSRWPGSDRQVLRHVVRTMTFHLSEAPWLSFPNAVGTEYRMEQNEKHEKHPTCRACGMHSLMVCESKSGPGTGLWAFT